MQSTWDPGLRPALLRLHRNRDRLLGLVEGGPRTLGHLDFWSANVIAARDGSTVLIDWAFTGDAALGEDVSNLVAEAVLDRFLPPDRLPALAGRVLDAYLAGLAEEGWTGNRDAVRVSFLASAVKWHWMGPLHLERARTGEHNVYGGDDAPDPEAQYAARGAALRTLAGWADEALRLAERMGI